MRSHAERDGEGEDLFREQRVDVFAVDEDRDIVGHIVFLSGIWMGTCDRFSGRAGSGMLLWEGYFFIILRFGRSCKSESVCNL